MFSNQNSAEFSILTDLNGYIQQLLDITRLVDASTSNPNITTIQDRNPSLLKICYCVETILSNGLKDVNFLSSTVMWDFLQNLPQCLPDTGRIIELSKDCSKTSIGRGRILIRLALNDGCLDEYISALCFSEGILKSYYKETAPLRNSEFLGLFQGLISMLSHIQFSLVVKDKDLDKPTYWSDIALTLLTNVDRQTTRTRIVEKEIIVEKEKEIFIEKIVEKEKEAQTTNGNDNTASSMVSSESTLSLEELESVLSEITSTSPFIEDEQPSTTTATATTTTTIETVTLPPPIPEYEVFTISENDFKRWDLIIDGLGKAKKKVILDFGAKGSALTMADTNGCLELLWGSIDKFLSNDIRIVTDNIENLWECISNISTSDDGISNNVQKEIVSNIELMYSDQFKRIRAFYYRGVMSHSSFPTYLSQFYQYQDTVQHSLLIRYYKKSSIVMQLDYMVKFFEILTDLTNTVTFRLKWDKDVLSLIEPKQPKKTMVTKIIKKKIIVKKTIPKKELEQHQLQQQEKERLEKEQADIEQEQLKLQQQQQQQQQQQDKEEVDSQIEDLQSILNNDSTPKEIINLSNSVDSESIKSYQSGSNSNGGYSNNGSNNDLVEKEKEILVGEEEEAEEQDSLFKQLEQRKKEQDEIEKLEILVHSRPLPERKSTLTEVLKKEKEMFSASLANNNNNNGNNTTTTTITTTTSTSSSSNEDDVNSEHFQNLLSSLKSSQEPMEFRYQSNPTYSSYTDSYNNEPFYMGGASSLTDDKMLLKSSSSIDYHMISDYFNDNNDDDSSNLSSSSNGATRSNNSYKSVKKNKNLLIGEDGQLFNNTLYRSSMIKSKYSVQGVCPGCHIQLEKLGFFKTRICYYTGKYYCNNCHTNQKSLIPSRILWHWDFKLYSVCDSAKSYITRNYSNPFDIFQFNPESIQLSTRLVKILSMRTRLHFIGEYIESCRNKVTLEGTIPQLNDYFVSGNVNLYSLSDLEKVNNGTQLELTIQEVMEKYIDHISNACIICKGKGFICEFCDSDELIFSWMSLDNVNYSKCDKCFTLSHKKCFSKDRCPKCIRISRVKTASSSSSSSNSGTIKSNSVQLQIK